VRAIALVATTLLAACDRGGCGGDPTATADAASPVVLARGQEGHPRGVAVARGFVYFAAYEDAALRRVPTVGVDVPVEIGDGTVVQPIPAKK
jgi:hypothetical protein